MQCREPHVQPGDQKDVNFVICNTDSQALDTSPVPNKVQLGPGLAKGRGAVLIRKRGRMLLWVSQRDQGDAGKEYRNGVRYRRYGWRNRNRRCTRYCQNCQGEMGVLTIGIVTMPFGFEGKRRREQAERGLAEMREM